jgi:hypothetical protein
MRTAGHARADMARMGRGLVYKIIRLEFVKEVFLGVFLKRLQNKKSQLH